MTSACDYASKRSCLPVPGTLRRPSSPRALKQQKTLQPRQLGVYCLLAGKAKWKSRALRRNMFSIVKKFAIVAAALLLVVMTATPANNSEQLVFSKTAGFMLLNGNTSDLHGTGG